MKKKKKAYSVKPEQVSTGYSQDMIHVITACRPPTRFRINWVIRSLWIGQEFISYICSYLLQSERTFFPLKSMYFYSLKIKCILVPFSPLLQPRCPLEFMNNLFSSFIHKITCKNRTVILNLYLKEGDLRILHCSCATLQMPSKFRKYN